MEVWIRAQKNASFSSQSGDIYPERLIQSQMSVLGVLTCQNRSEFGENQAFLFVISLIAAQTEIGELVIVLGLILLQTTF